MWPNMWHLEDYGDGHVDLRFLFESGFDASEPREWFGLPEISDDLLSCERLHEWLNSFPPDSDYFEMAGKILNTIFSIMTYWDEYCEWFWANKKHFRKLDTYDD